MLDFLQAAGLLNRPILYPLNESMRIAVPVSRTRMDAIDVGQYESNFIDRLVSSIAQFQGTFTLIDGGADFGLFSLKLLSKCPAIGRILAFEPNEEAYFTLKGNLDRLAMRAEAFHRALADFEGRGSLEMPSQDIAKLSKWPLDHAARFLKRSPDGPIQVTTIDALCLNPGGNVVIKLDIEGGELAAIRGARNTVRVASNVIVAIEANPLVSERTAVDPVECLRALTEVRDFAFVVAENGASLNLDRLIFDQVPREVCNLICVCSESASAETP
jgi:FkbM family methyltransferase